MFTKVLRSFASTKSKSNKGQSQAQTQGKSQSQSQRQRYPQSSTAQQPTRSYASRSAFGSTSSFNDPNYLNDFDMPTYYSYEENVPPGHRSCFRNLPKRSRTTSTWAPRQQPRTCARQASAHVDAVASDSDTTIPKPNFKRNVSFSPFNNVVLISPCPSRDGQPPRRVPPRRRRSSARSIPMQSGSRSRSRTQPWIYRQPSRPSGYQYDSDSDDYYDEF